MDTQLESAAAEIKHTLGLGEQEREAFLEAQFPSTCDRTFFPKIT